MAEETAKTPEQIAAEATEKQRRDEMREAVAAGVETAFETVLKRAGENAPVVKEAAPTEPAEPTTDDIDRQIDEAITAGQPIGALQRKRDEIVEQRVERRLVRPLREQGGAAISSLVADTLVNEPHYTLLKPTIDAILATVSRGTVITKQHMTWAYNQAYGQNRQKIEQIVAENALRKAAEPPVAQVPGMHGRGVMDEDDENADFTTAFGKGTAAVFKRKTSESKQKRSEDDEARMMGFQDRKDMNKQRKAFEDSDDFSLGLDK